MMIKEIILKNSVVVNERYVDKYLSLIEHYKNQLPGCPIENHHIIPKSFGGDNSKNNMLKLSPRQHYIAHLLLAKATNSPKMIKALHKMVYSRSGSVSREYKITSRVYEYLRTEHCKVVSNYSKNTVVAKQLYTEEIKRIPKKLFDKYNGILYEAVSKGRKDSQETKKLKSAASTCPRIVKKGSRTRSLAASKYSYDTPKGYCENSTDLLRLYPTFTKNSIGILKNEYIINAKFASIHPEFKDFIGKSLSEIGFKRNLR